MSSGVSFRSLLAQREKRRADPGTLELTFEKVGVAAKGDPRRSGLGRRGAVAHEP